MHGFVNCIVIDLKYLMHPETKLSNELVPWCIHLIVISAMHWKIVLARLVYCLVVSSGLKYRTVEGWRNKTCFAFNVFSMSWCRSLTWAETASVKDAIITSSTLLIPANCAANFCSWDNLDCIISKPDLSKMSLRCYLTN